MFANLRSVLLTLAVAAAASAAEVPRAKWIENGLIDAGGSHEPVIFQIRTGGQRRDVRQQHAKTSSEELLRKLKSQGVEVFHTQLYKGFGMAAEKEDMEETKRVVEMAHRIGLKVDTYLQWNSLMYETFLAEEPRAKDWVQRDEAGKPIMLTYDYEQSFRYRPCFKNPEYLAYLKKIVRYAVVEVKTDFLHFDNYDLNAEPESCHCQYCVRGFRDHLKKKYPPEVRKERFGFENVDFVEPTMWNAGNKPENMRFIRDPGIQEWIDFRCQLMSDALGEIAAYAKSLNPEVVIEVNPHGITGGNRAFEAGLDHARFLKHTQVFWTEDENAPGMERDGRLISKIRSYKMARTFGNIVLTYTSGSDVAMAECLAFNQTMGFAGSDPIAPGMLKYMDFYRKNRQMFNGSKDVAPVALLRSYPSITYNHGKTQLAAFLTEQALIQSHIPFALIFDEHLADLSKYKVLVLPDSECLSDAQVEAIHKFVANGGGLVAIGDSGFYDEWRRRRVEPGFADMVTYPRRYRRREEGAAAQEPAAPVRKEVARGRVAYIPQAQFDGPLPTRAAFDFIDNRYWKRPANWAQIVDAVQWASAGSLGVNIGGPETLVANVVAQPGRQILHLVNYGAKSGALAAAVPVELQAAEGKTVKSITVTGPDASSEQTIKFEQAAGKVRFSVPPMPVYSMVVVNY